ncbi:MAG TPA: EamA family transporter, partial [Burkholderiales bacterium]|nr:EamA family transporter [Burkholderiales bacterium]
VVLAIYKVATGAATTLIGFMLVILAALSWSIGNIIAKRAAGEHAPDMFSLVIWSSLVAPLPLAALSYLLEGGIKAWHAVAHMSVLAWACVLGMSYGATVFGFGSWNRLLHRYPMSLIAPFALLIPVSGLASGVLFLDESIAPMQALGIALVLVGLVINVWQPRRT